MRKLTFRAVISMAFLAILTINLHADDGIKGPTILGGKIWSGSDTLDLAKKDSSDSIFTITADTSATDKRKGINWASDQVITLEDRDISSGTDLLKLKLSIPPTLKFIKDTPVELAVKSSNPDIIDIGQGEGKDPSKGFAFPLKAKPGTADLFLYYRVVCCTTGADSVCFFKEAKLRIPVTVGDSGDEILEIRHRIEN